MAHQAASAPATIVDALTNWAERTPDAIAFVGPEGESFTFRGLASGLPPHSPGT